ncbi:transposase [Thermoanaerobacterium thermosaccharolyticum]|uniref:transposase n=1 Tax=Thermoanaerobacterium thermosaccharolyticum TaxID=1517 RepID=UPI003DA84DBB
MIKQLHFSDFIDDFHKFVVVKKPQLLELLDQYINICELIPVNWYFHYNKATGRPHDNSLDSIVSTLLLQKLLSIPTIDLLITFLSFSKELRDFCGLNTVPDASFYSRFKQDYCDDIEAFFHKLVDITEPICQEIGQALEKELGINPAEVYIMDTTGIECYVKENNPKFFNALVKKLQYFNKDKSKEDIYKMAYNQMPKTASVDPNIKLQYINGTFCYAHKTIVVSNALGILRHMDFCDYQPDFNDYTDSF